MQPDQPRQAVLRLPTGSAVRSGWAGIGSAGTMAARASRRTNSSTTRPDRAVRTRHNWRRTVRQGLGALGDISRGLAETSRTATRSV